MIFEDYVLKNEITKNNDSFRRETPFSELLRYIFKKKKDKISLNSSERLYKFIYKMVLLKTCSYTFEPWQNCVWHDSIVFLF
jgi:hypothetical protein